MRQRLVKQSGHVVLASVMMLALVAGVRGALQGAFEPDGGAAAVPLGNGDVNADGAYDITDAIYILNWLFTGGSAPVPVECQGQGCEDELANCQAELQSAIEATAALSAQVAQLEAQLADCIAGNCPEAALGLPATGQTKCYSSTGAEAPCGSGTCPGQDGFYAAGCPSQDRFVDNGDGTVTDNCTGLMWQKDPGDNGNGLSWCNALAYCENLTLAGHRDWRLPNVRELQSIVDYGRYGPAIDPAFGGLSAYFWSSTSVGVKLANAWLVDFGGGSVAGGGGIAGVGKENAIYVRAVRDAK